MFSRALRVPRAMPLRVRAPVPSIAARRLVTTDAASSHVDKSAIPQVSLVCGVFGRGQHGTIDASTTRNNSRGRCYSVYRGAGADFGVN